MKIIMGDQVNTILLEGVVGSQAYGLAHKDSDIDKKGIFAYNTSYLFGLNYRTMSDVLETHAPNPDLTLYEVAKWCNLALKCNPNILEMVYLPDHLYTVRDDLGNCLIDIREAFLSQDAVKTSYINYARSQLHKIERRGDFGSDMKKRTEKHARHLVRLMVQGFQLYSTGNLTVRLDEETATYVKAVGVAAGNGDIAHLRNVYEKYEQMFNEVESALPYKPDVPAVEGWLKHVRQRLLK